MHRFTEGLKNAAKNAFSVLFLCPSYGEMLQWQAFCMECVFPLDGKYLRK